MASSENKRELILTRSPGRLMVSLSLPAIVGMVVIGLYTFVDAIYAGQLIGVDAMGAVSIAYPFTFINSGLAAMIGMGSASVLSRAIGARDQKSIDQVMGNLVVMNLVLSLAVTVVGVAFARPLLALTGAEGAMLDLGECYLRIIFLGSLFVNFAQSSNMIMRGEGELARAMGIMAGGAILNMVLAPVFILALRDQGLGLEGAACATVLSQAVLAGVMLWWFVFSRLTNHHSMTPAWIICVITVAQPAPWMPSPWSRRARMNRGASTMLRTAPPPMMAMARASSPLPRMTMFELCAKFTNRLPTSMMRR